MITDAQIVDVLCTLAEKRDPEDAVRELVPEVKALLKQAWSEGADAGADEAHWKDGAFARNPYEPEDIKAEAADFLRAHKARKEDHDG